MGLLNWLFRRDRSAQSEPDVDFVDQAGTNAWSFLNETPQPHAAERAEVLLVAPVPGTRRTPLPAASEPTPRPAAAPVATRPALVAPVPRPAPVALRRLIVYGNCQAAVIEGELNRISGIRDRWTVARHDLWDSGEKLEQNLRDFEDCDVLLLQELRNWRTHPLHDSLPPHIKVVRYPFVYFTAMWPFDAFQNGPDPACVFEKGVRDFSYADNLLARLRTDIPDPEARFQTYRSLDVADCPDIARCAEFEAARLLQLDRKLGFTVGRYILDNYKTSRLFHAVTHPSADVMSEVIDQILAKLDLHDARRDEVPDNLAFTQVPIHPLVIERLGLRWARPDAHYRFTEAEELTFDEYTRRYIAAYG